MDALLTVPVAVPLLRCGPHRIRGEGGGGSGGSGGEVDIWIEGWLG